MPIVGSLKNCGTPFFHGIDPFHYLYEQGRIQPGSRIVVSKFGNSIEEKFLVTKDGQLERIAARGIVYEKGTFLIADVLNLKYAPDGWIVQPLLPKQPKPKQDEEPPQTKAKTRTTAQTKK